MIRRAFVRMFSGAVFASMLGVKASPWRLDDATWEPDTMRLEFSVAYRVDEWGPTGPNGSRVIERLVPLYVSAAP